jgi:tetraacyldisaccharide 4'-kinase
VLKPSAFRDLVSGRRRGVGAALLRAGLRAAELPYTLAVRWRNWRYDTGRAAVHRVPVPVVSVGNLTLGGTGKTPMVQWIARWLRSRRLRVTVISRGYGAEAGAANDEALELEQNLPDVPHLEDPDRVAAARLAVEQLGCQGIVLDDAFQHRRIHRDLDLVMLDALEPFGFGHVFPRGTLREPLTGLRRADMVVLSRADMLEADQRAEIRARVARHAPDAAWAEVIHAPQALLSCGGEREPLDSLRAEPVGAFCGIGNPAGFRHTLEQCGYRIADFREFPDHHAYDRADVESLAAWADGLEVAAVVCTHKDLVKLSIDRLGRRRLWAVTIGMEFLAGQPDLEAALASVPRAARLPVNPP